MKHYSFWSNFKFAYGPVWREKRNYIRDTFLEILFSVGVPLFGSAISALIIGLLGSGAGVFTVICCIIASFLGYATVNAAQTFVLQKHGIHNIEVRLELFFVRVVKKHLNMSLEKCEDADIRLMSEKANMAISNNWAGIEGFFRYGTRLGVGIAGLIVYSCIAGSIHPLILLMLLVLSLVSALIDNLPQWYYNKTKDQIAADMITMRYIDKVVDNVAAGKDIRVFGLKPWIIGKYDKAIMDVRRLNAKKNVLAFIGSTSEITFCALRDVVCYLYLIYLLKNGMSMTEFIFYLGIVGGFSSWFQQVSQNLVKMRSCSLQISDIRNFLDLETEDGARKKLPQNNFEQIEVVFDHVSYRYAGAKDDVLKDVSFRIAPGEHVALVGLNGAGKSTLAKLLSGLYHPTEGDIYVNGVSTKEIDDQAYYKHQAAVFQDTFTLAYSIGENIALTEEWNEARVWECLKIAGLEEKVRALPDGLNTYLGKDLSEQGISLSGGETQKLLLARALYRRPSLILLDEPTAALDALAESEIYGIYNTALEGVTSLFISHRLASTRFCQNIILLEGGRIAEYGSHDRLMEEQGRYYELFKVQSKYYEEGGDSDVD